MKALVYLGPRQLEIRQLAVPEVGANEILLGVRATGICGSDQGGFLGRDKRRVPPLVLGHEFSGEILKVGTAVARAEPGVAVCVYPFATCGQCQYCLAEQHQRCAHRKLFGLHAPGAFAEYVSVPEECVFPMPDGMTYLEGALVEPLATALHSLERSPPVKGKVVLIFGAGPIGLLQYLVAKHSGAASVAIVEPNGYRRETAQRMGADLTVDPTEGDPVEAVREWTGGRGVDVAFDAAGSGLSREHAIAALAAGGTIVLVGLEDERSALNIRMIQAGELDLRGSYAYTRREFQTALSLLEQRVFPISQFVSEAPLESGPRIFEELTTGETCQIKVVLTM